MPYPYRQGSSQAKKPAVISSPAVPPFPLHAVCGPHFHFHRLSVLASGAIAKAAKAVEP